MRLKEDHLMEGFIGYCRGFGYYYEQNAKSLEGF